MTKAERKKKYREAKERVLTRMKQWEIVDHGDTEEAVSMAIFLGKQYLGQREDPDEIEVPPEEWEGFFRELIGESDYQANKEDKHEQV